MRGQKGKEWKDKTKNMQIFTVYQIIESQQRERWKIHVNICIYRVYNAKK